MNKLIDSLFATFSNELKLGKTTFKKTNRLINKEQLIKYAQWSKPSYTRVCLKRDENCEMILICWNPDSETPLHNHNGEKCTVFFFNGDFEETISCPEGKNILNITNIKTGTVAFKSQSEWNCHSLKNISTRRAMTLHLYSNPIYRCGVFNKKMNRIEEKSLNCDVVANHCETMLN